MSSRHSPDQCAARVRTVDERQLMSAHIPDSLVHLLADPNYGHLATVRPDGTTRVARFSGHRVEIFVPTKLKDNPTMVFRTDAGNTLHTFDLCSHAHQGIAEEAACFGLCLINRGLKPVIPR